MEKKPLGDQAVFAQAYEELKAEGYYAKLAKALKLKSKTNCRAIAATGEKKNARPEKIVTGEKTSRRQTGSILSACK